MSTPAFFGFYNAQRSIIAAQAGMNVVNHNIANANTPGYTKQRVDITTEAPYQAPDPHSGLIYQFGQGPKVMAITRVRDNFLDNQYRQETGTQGQLEIMSEVFRQVEDVVGEPNDTGLANGIQQLFNAIQDMSTNPESLSARSAFLQQGVDLTFLFQQQGKQLQDLHKNLVGEQGNASSFGVSQLGLAINDINTKLQSVADLNREIATVVSSGGSANDLLDRRTELLKSLSSLADIDVKDLPNEQVQISLGGQVLVKNRFVLDTLTTAVNTGGNATAVPALVKTVTGNVDLTTSLTGGKIKGILDIAGLDTSIKNVSQVFNELNAVFDQLATTMNTVQQSGRDLAGAQHNGAADPVRNIFTTSAAYTSGPKLLFYQVNQNLLDQPEKLALAADDSTAPGNYAGPGDNRNALAFSALRSTTYSALGGQTFEDYHQTLVARMGTNAKSYKDRQENHQGMLGQLEGRQSGVSGVNLDEETIDLVRYQKAYEASSRVIRAFNDMYDALMSMI